MSAVDDITAQLPIGDLAARLGADPNEVEQAVRSAVPALLGGMHANAQDPAGAASLADALSQHDAALVDGLGDGGLDRVDTHEGQQIASHVFGQHEDQVVDQLAGVTGGSGGSALLRKLIPILAPIVMSYVAKQLSAKGTGGAGGAGSGNVLGDILGQVLGGAAQGAGGSGSSGSQGGLGGVLGSVLGGLLGGGRR